MKFQQIVDRNGNSSIVMTEVEPDVAVKQLRRTYRENRQGVISTTLKTGNSLMFTIIGLVLLFTIPPLGIVILIMGLFGVGGAAKGRRISRTAKAAWLDARGVVEAERENRSA